jgi:tape measure domain-containing protein
MAGGNLDDLEFKLDIDLQKSLSGLRMTVVSLDAVKTSIIAVDPAARRLAASVRDIDFKNLGSSSAKLYSVASAAEGTAEALDKVSTAAHAVESGITSIAFSADTASRASSNLTKVLNTVAGEARLVSTAATGAGSVLRQMSGAIMHIAHNIHAVMIVTDLLTTAFAMLMVPVRAVWSVAVAAFNALTMVVSAVLLPVKLLVMGFVGLAKAAWSIVSPLLSLSLSVAKVWFVFRGWIGAIKVIGTWLAMLPPPIRLVVGGLLALGVAGKAGAGALKVLSFGLSLVSTAVGVAATAIRVLTLPILVLLNPVRAASIAISLMTSALMLAGRVAVMTASALYSVAAAAGAMAARGFAAAASSVTGMLGSLVRLTSQVAIYGAIAAVVFGAKVAIAVEKNIAVFGTMVHSMEQGAAIVASIQKTKAAGLFDNQELLDSSRLLFKGGVAAVDLAAKTDQLAKIAAGTSTELGDLARIYQQGANRGSFGQDKINQLSERGIAIYEGLQHATGKSGAALDKMISDGKIGITEMDAAMAYLTEGNGYYANSLEDIGNTTGGMLTQIKNNLMQTLGALAGVGIEAFKPVLTSILAMSEGIKSSVGAIAPIVNQLFMVIKGAFGGMHAVVNTTYTNIFGATTATFGGMLSVVMQWVTKFRWFFENIVPIIQFVGLSMVSIMVTAFNDIAYFLTDKMPAYLSWFAENWKNIFTDIFNGTVAIFTNLGKNIAMAMTQIWNFITSGGTAELEFAWTPLLDGFESTVAALPDIPDRAMTELEQSLEQQTQAVATQLADSFDALNVEAQAALTVAAPELPAIDPTLQAGGTGDGTDTGAGKNNRTDFSVSGMERGSEAALKAIFSAQKDKTPSQALAEHKKTNAHLATIANKPQPAVLGGVT